MRRHFRKDFSATYRPIYRANLTDRRYYVYTRAYSACRKVKREPRPWLIRADSRSFHFPNGWHLYSGLFSNRYLIIDELQVVGWLPVRIRGLRVRNNKLHSQREICSAGHEPKLLWSLSIRNRNALFAVARVCSRILLLDSCVRRPTMHFAGREPAIRKSKYSMRKKLR